MYCDTTEPTSFTTKAFSITEVKPLSWREDRSDGSWKTYTVTTSIAVEERNKLKIGSENFEHASQIVQYLRKMTLTADNFHAVFQKAIFCHQ